MNSRSIKGKLSMVLALSGAAGLMQCNSGGRYGYAREYVYLPEEQPFAQRADESAVYDEVRRLPDRFADHVLTWWGIVSNVEPGTEGLTRVTLQLRTHQVRHLCEDETDGSCRVTINDRDGGSFTVLLRLNPDDLSGENRVQPLALLHVYGTVVQGEYNSDGGPVLRGQYYRHWPRGQFVTTASSGGMRR
jgi:hypothetical protein